MDKFCYIGIILAGLFLTSGCYTFKGISIDPNVNTFYVSNFDNTAGNAPPTLALDFTERLKDKVRTESRLKLNDEKPDVEFKGTFRSYQVKIIAPKPGEVAALNQLEIVVEVSYTNNLNPEANWENRRFSHFAEFSSSQDLLSVQDNLILEINKQLAEDIFNAAFNNW